MDLAYKIHEDHAAGKNIEELYPEYKEKYPAVFKSIAEGMFNKEHFSFLLNSVKEWKPKGNNFGIDKKVGEYFRPMLGDELLKTISKKDLAKAERKCAASAQAARSAQSKKGKSL